MDQTAARSKGLESDCQSLTPGPITCHQCDLDKLLNPSVPQFLYLYIEETKISYED